MNLDNCPAWAQLDKGYDMSNENDLTLSEWKSAFEALTNSPAWRRLSAAIQGQVDSLQQEVLFRPLVNEGDVLTCERRKGMLEGRLALNATAMGIVSEIEMEMDRLKGDAS